MWPVRNTIKQYMPLTVMQYGQSKLTIWIVLQICTNRWNTQHSESSISSRHIRVHLF